MTPPAPRRVIVLRHGETEANRTRTHQGQADVPLSEVGHRQAVAAAALLVEDTSIVRVLSSDLSRARDTARIVAESLGTYVEVEPRLREIDVGEWTGMTYDAVWEANPGLRERFAAGEDVRRGVTGETAAEVAWRVGGALRDTLASVSGGETVLMVTHGVAARVAAGLLLRWDQSTTWRSLDVLGNARWGTLAEGSNGWSISEWNHGPAGAAGTPEGYGT